MGVTVAPESPATVRQVVDAFAADGIGVLAEARLDEVEWQLLDSVDRFKTSIAVARP